MLISDTLESEVRSYCRMFPTVFVKSEDSYIYDKHSRRFIDFFAGAGALNYGHNNSIIKERLITYITNNGIAHALDMATEAKNIFMDRFVNIILRERNFDYKLMFPGPGGTIAIEAALKLARKVTGRLPVIAFRNAFHGMTLGALAVTDGESRRTRPAAPVEHTCFIPFDGQPESLEQLDILLNSDKCNSPAPAAFIVETIQAEGGVNVATTAWLQRLAEIAKQLQALLIIDDIQVGCGRTGSFFSFESAGIQPDIICLSKSLSGLGLPFALNLIRPDLDIWKPGEHNGTFRGNNYAFVTATAALETYWQNDLFSQQVNHKATQIAQYLQKLATSYGAQWRGRGLIQGLSFDDPRIASQVSKEAFARGLIIETAGPEQQVLKLLPPLTTEPDVLEEGLEIVANSLAAVVA